MVVSEERLQTLLAALDAAAEAVDPGDACTKLQTVEFIPIKSLVAMA